MIQCADLISCNLSLAKALLKILAKLLLAKALMGGLISARLWVFKLCVPGPR